MCLVKGKDEGVQNLHEVRENCGYDLFLFVCDILLPDFAFVLYTILADVPLTTQLFMEVII